MANIKNMKAVVRKVVIEGEYFYGVRFIIDDTQENLESHGLSKVMYGTLPYSFCDENGVTVKTICLLHLAARKTLAEAINYRKQLFEQRKQLENLVKEGLIPESVLA